jgi:sugar phosphate isomerase/epimerase
MDRRTFLTAGAATVAAATLGTPAMRAQRARQPDPAKLERIAIMTLAFNASLKLPNQPAGPNRTLEVFDIPEMLADIYGVHNIEFQHEHLASTERSYLQDLRGRLERSKSRMTNVNLEFQAVNISASDPAQRREAVERTRQWIDHAIVLGCPRVMINQGALTEETKAWAIPALREMGEYGKAKGIKVSAETRLVFAARGGAPGAARGAGPAPAPGSAAPVVPATTAAPGVGAVPGAPAARMGGPAPARGVMQPRPILTTPPTWVLLAEVIKNAGVYATVDIGNVAAQDQGELHAALRTLLPMTVGSIHTRVSPAWDLATALRFMTVNLEYDGLFSVEAYGHDAVRNIYNIILDTI